MQIFYFCEIFDLQMHKFIFFVIFLGSFLLSTNSFSQIEEFDDVQFALLYYADKGNFDMVKTLIENYNAIADQKDENGITPIMYASQNGHDSIVLYLIAKDANINNVDILTNTSPLISAVKNNFISTAEILIRNGADINHQDVWGMTALHYAAMYGYETMCDMFLYYDADPSIRDNKDYLPLHYAISGNFDNIVNLLWLETDFSYNDKAKFAQIATQTGNLSYLKNFKTEIEDIPDENGFYLTENAVLNGQSKVFLYLLENNYKYRDTINQIYTLRSLAKYSSDRRTKKAVRKLEIKDIHYPYFGKLGIGYSMIFNSEDFFNDLNLSVNELRYGFVGLAGFIFRGYEKTVFLPFDTEEYYQLRETRYAAYLGIKKEFKFNKFFAKKYVSAFGGVSFNYNWGDYDGIRMKVSKEIIPCYYLGIAYKMSDYFKLYSSVHYMDIALHYKSSYYCNISLVGLLNIKNDETNQKYKYIIRY